jgi:hypothetical protein
MHETLLFLDEYQAWIYLVLGIAGLAYLRIAARWLTAYRRSIFDLERDRARSHLIEAGVLLGAVCTLGVLNFVVTTFVVPAVPVASRPTAIPTISLLSTPTLAGVAVQGDLLTSTPLPVAVIDTGGCQNPQATITAPVDGDAVSGVVEFMGTARIENFAFFKLEYIRLIPGSVWRAVSAGTIPVVEDRLGSWDTSLVLPGDYGFRLVVTDTAGNAPMPCAVRLQIRPPS